MELWLYLPLPLLICIFLLVKLNLMELPEIFPFILSYGKRYQPSNIASLSCSSVTLGWFWSMRQLFSKNVSVITSENRYSQWLLLRVTFQYLRLFKHSKWMLDSTRVHIMLHTITQDYTRTTRKQYRIKIIYYPKLTFIFNYNSNFKFIINIFFLV